MIKIKNSFSFFYHWHQRIGLVMCVAVIAWALSGLAHPLISRINPKPVFVPPSVPLQWQDVTPIEQLIKQRSIKQLHSLRLFQWQNRPVYRIHSEQGIAYFSATDLTEIDYGDKAYAHFMARHYLGDANSAVIDAQPIDQFNEDYLYINRYLPVMRVDFDRPDNARVYIDTAQGRLATIVDNNKALTGAFFRAFHSWTWIENLTLRRTLMSIFLVLGFFTAAFGLVVYIKSWRLGIFRKTLSAHQHHPLSRKVHRHMGAVVALFAMAFCFSGMFHLLISDKSDEPQISLPITVDATHLKLDMGAINRTLQRDEIVDIQLAQFGDKTYWQLRAFTAPAHAGGEHDHHHHDHHHHNHQPKDAVRYLDAQTGELLDNGWQIHARFLAARLTKYPADKIKHVQLVESFTTEYGFVNKRLPVHALDFDLPGAPSVYLETATNTLASQVTNSDRLEGYSFGYLHKWHFIDFLGKDMRDVLTSLMALAIMVVLLLGVYRYWATSMRRKRHAM